MDYYFRLLLSILSFFDLVTQIMIKYDLLIFIYERCFIMLYSKETRIMILKNRIEKLEKNFDNAKLVAKVKRRLRNLENS